MDIQFVSCNGDPEYLNKLQNSHDAVKTFHELFYDGNCWQHVKWMGHHILKTPMDILIYQEIIFNSKPDVIIETGTRWGGSAFFMAQMCDLVGNGEIVTVDIAPFPDRPEHPRITYLNGSSISQEIFSQMAEKAAGKSTMVILDSAHITSHVLAEMNLYADLVTPGNYMIVEDTNVNGHPVSPNYTEEGFDEVGGPMESVAQFMTTRDDFVIDSQKHKFLLTFNPNGYLRRKPA